MSIAVKAWKCDFCGRASINRGAISQHEAACRNNPQRRHCKTCVHSGCKITEHHNAIPADGMFSATPEWDSKEIWCFKHDVPMHEKPWLIACELEHEYHYGYDNPAEHPIPFTCEHYEQEEHHA